MPPGVIPAGVTVLDLPIDEGIHGAIPQYRAVIGGYRTINGYSGYELRYYTPLRHAIAETRPEWLAEYRRVSDLYVILRSGETADVAHWIATHPDAQLIQDFGQARIYRFPHAG